MAARVTANGANIPAIGLGTWDMTGAACSKVVADALAAGYRHVDTATVYENEDAVGAGLADSPAARADIFLTTKVWHTNLAEDRLRASIEASLKRLRTDYVDLLLVHWPSREVPLSETMAALGRVKREGLTRNIGVSNFTTRLIAEAVAVADEPIATNQVEYHPWLSQEPVLAACRAHGISVTAYQPIARGQVLKEPAITEIAAAHGRTPAQVALRWLVQQPGVIAIPKSADPGRIRENLAVFDFELSGAEMSAISSLARADGRLGTPEWSPDWD